MVRPHVRVSCNEPKAEPVPIAKRNIGWRILIEEMSEGTRDRLYLALRLAATDIRRAGGVDLPTILDDVLITSDEEWSGPCSMPWPNSYDSTR